MAGGRRVAGRSWNAQFDDLRDYFGVAWYKTTFEMPKGRTPHVLLRFGAVDYAAEVYVNGHRAGAHEGAYTPFSVDVADFVRSGHERGARARRRSAADRPGGLAAIPRHAVRGTAARQAELVHREWRAVAAGDARREAVAVHGARPRQREDRRHGQRGRGAQGRQPAPTDDDQGVDSGAGRVHRRGPAAGAGLEGRRAAHDAVS